MQILQLIVDHPWPVIGITIAFTFATVRIIAACRRKKDVPHA